MDGSGAGNSSLGRRYRCHRATAPETRQAFFTTLDLSCIGPNPSTLQSRSWSPTPCTRRMLRTFVPTLMEAELLRHLIRNSGKVVSRKQILEEVWGLHEDTDTRAIDNFIVRLRKYIEKDPSSPQHLLTVRGIGYRFLPSPVAEK